MIRPILRIPGTNSIVESPFPEFCECQNIGANPLIHRTISARIPVKRNFAALQGGKCLEFTSNIFCAAASWGGG